MKRYLYELHLHTKEGSGCAVSSGAEMADRYKSAGFDGIFVTDHFFNGNCAVSNEIPWRERVELYCKGYENAKARGDEIGLKVFFGWEYTYYGSDFLTYGLDKEWLKSHPEVMDFDIKHYCDFIHINGGFIIHGHPFRERGYIEKMTLVPRSVDAVEGFNGGHFPDFEEFNRRAVWYANSYGLPITAGSDNHNAGGSITGGIAAEKPINSCGELLDVIRSGKYSIYWKGEIIPVPKNII